MEGLKERRIALGLTQAALASRCFCSKATISRLECNNDEPPAKLARRLKQALMTNASADDKKERESKQIPNVPFRDDEDRKLFHELWCARHYLD